MKILIIGATGNIGTQTVKLLAHNKQPVIAASRNLQKLKDHLDLPGIEYRNFDFTDHQTWQPALDGVSRLFLVVPPGSATEDQQTAFFSAAKAAGVKHIVFSSGRTTGPLAGSPLNRTETFIKNSGMDWTILRPGWFMQNFINWIGFTIPREDAFYLPADDAKTAFVDVRDLGAVAATILMSPKGHTGKIYDLTSAGAIDHHEAARLIGKAAGRPIRYVSLSEQEFTRTMVEKGWNQKAAEKTAWLYQFVRAGKEAAVSNDTANILGQQPIDFERFTKDHAHKW